MPAAVSVLSPMAAWSHPIYLRLMRQLLRRLQVDADAVLAEAQLSWDRLATATEGQSYEAVALFIRACLQATQQPWLGLELGRASPPSAHGPTGFAVLASADLRQALEVFARYACLRTSFFDWRCEPTRGGIELQVGENLDFGDNRRFLLDLVLAAVCQVIAAITGQATDGLRVAYPMAAPAWRERYRSLLGVEVDFDAPRLCISVPQDWLVQPCLSADPRAFEAALQECEALRSSLLAAGTTQRVRDLLAASSDYPSLLQAAERLHLSAQTLMRRLKREGSSFQALLDELRQGRARWYLEQTSLSVEEIAVRLGYQDTSNFSRTARRWFGQTPGELRLRARAASAESP